MPIVGDPFPVPKTLEEFQWSWPKKIDRQAIEELFSLSFIKSGHNAVLVFKKIS